MLTTERLEEMRQAELRTVQYPGQHHGVKRVSEELAEALGELIERRVDPNNPAWRRMQYEAVAAATRGFTVEHETEPVAVEEPENQLLIWGGR
jgi:hypothetical protein